MDIKLIKEYLDKQKIKVVEKYDFDKGRGFQPDFLLFLKQKKKNFYY